MDTAMKELINSGAIGAILAIVMLMLFWIVRVIITNTTDQTKAMTKGMEELVAQSRAIRDNCRTCRQDSLATLRDAESTITAKIEHVAWAVHDKTFSETKDLIGTARESIEKSIAVNTQSIRDVREEVSRPHTVTPGSGVVRR
jgi:hypothetical protein